MDGLELPAIPVAGRFGLELPGKLLSFLGFLVFVRYSFLIIHAVDQVQASPPAMPSSSSFELEHEKMLAYYLLWTLGLLAMLLPPLIANYRRLMQFAGWVMNTMFPAFFDEVV